MELRGKFKVTAIKKRTTAEFFKDLKVGDTFELRYALSGSYSGYAPEVFIEQDGVRKHINSARQLRNNLMNFEIEEV